MTVITDIQTPEGGTVSGTIKVHNVVDIGEHCTHCGCDVSPGSGAWVNRIPSGAMSADGVWELDGYMCADCQCMECGTCGQSSAEWGSDNNGNIICDECAEKGTEA